MTELWVINVYYQPDRTVRLTYKTEQTFSLAVESITSGRLLLADDFGMQVEVPVGKLNGIVACKLSGMAEADAVYSVEIASIQSEIQERYQTRQNLLKGGRGHA